MNAPEPPASATGDSEVEDRVVALLAEYLLAAGHLSWPGTDGLTVKDAVKELYVVASAAGRAPNPAELAHRHPELTAAVIAFFR
jgi:hypothetical protein